MASQVSISGLKDLQTRLNKLNFDVAGRVARAATAAGANVVVNAAKKSSVISPGYTGNARAALVSRRNRLSKLTSAHTIGYRVAKTKDAKAAKKGTGQLGKDAFYMQFVELGTVKSKAQPVLRPAMEKNIQPALEAVKDRLKKRLDKAGV